MSYLDIDQILLANEKVPLTINQFSKNVNFLKTIDVKKAKKDMEKSNDLPEESEIFVPLWFALDLHENELAKFEKLPQILGKEMILEMESTDFKIDDAKCRRINLQKLSDYYFEIGTVFIEELLEDESITDLFREEVRELSSTLLKIFIKRYKALLIEVFHTSSQKEKDSMENERTSIERDLYELGKGATDEFNNWEKHGYIPKLTSHKRKREADFESLTKVKKQKFGK